MLRHPKQGPAGRRTPSAIAMVWGIATVLGGVLLSWPVDAYAWGAMRGERRTAPKPPDQSWLQDVPEKPGARSRGKVAVFVFNGDDVYQPVRGAVVRALRKRGLNVTANLRPVDSAAQYREMSQTLQLAVFIDGEVKGEGARQSAQIRLRSGVTGQNMVTATFSGPTQKIVGDVNQKLWARVGPAISRSCVTASKRRRRERAPLRIEAGTPEDLPITAQKDS